MAEVDETDDVDTANKLETNCLTNNLEISLFFEEKFVLCFKIFQLYGILFMFFYEEFPSRVR